MKCIVDMGSDEFRLFKTLNYRNDEEYQREALMPFLKSYTKTIEQRIDFYIFPLNLEYKKLFNYGIKFRNVKFNQSGNLVAKKLELKIRLSHKEGIEKWIKPISVNFEKIILLKKFKQEEIKEHGYYVKIDNSLYTVNIKEIIECIKTEFRLYINDNDLIDNIKIPLGFGITNKNRTKISGEDVLFKLITFKLESEKKEIQDSMNHYRRSYCFEGLISTMDIEYINSISENNDLIGGYPEALLKLI